MPQVVVNCLICNSSITDLDFRVVLCQEEYPDIEIGPFCESCMGKIKICSGCQKPHIGSECHGSDSGEYYCPTCFDALTKCPRCNQICTVSDLVASGDEHGRVCKGCLRNHYFNCSCCDTIKSLKVEVISTSIEGLERAGIFRKYKRICKGCFESKKNVFKKYDIRRCQHCSNLYTYKEGMQEHYCDYCYNNFKTCSCCNQKKPNIRPERVVDTEASCTKSMYLCSSCTSKWERCNVCNMLHNNSTTIFIKGTIKTHKVCPNCKKSSECKNCGGLFQDSTGSKTLCDTCDKMFVQNKCGVCGQVKDMSGRCRVCQTMGIYSYSSKPTLFYNYLEKDESRRDALFFGFENEVTFGSADSSKNKRLKDLYKAYDCSVLSAKSDGSIEGYGYEVVSQPMSLLYFNKLDLSPILPKGLKQSTSCGLHVHVGREHFASDVHLYKVINLLRDNEKFTTYTAGRPPCGYSARIGVKATSHILDSKKGNTERRSMVNLTNSATVEFRLFAGCTTEFELRSRIESLHALIIFCKGSSIAESRSVERFIKWLNSNEAMYPHAAQHFSKFTI